MGSNFALGVKALRVLAMSIFLFSLFDSLFLNFVRGFCLCFALALFN